ncbi:MAG: lysophospholipase [Anaerolineaceae bacterium]
MTSSTEGKTNKKREEFPIRATDSLELHGGSLGDPSDAEAIVVLVHGLGEHMKRYRYVAEMMTDQGLCVVGFDQRGHGNSSGERGYIPSVKQLMDDISSVIELAQAKNPDLPVFLYGHSLGGLEVLYYSLTKKPELRGVISTSPSLDITSTPKSKRAVAKALKPIMPGLTVSNGINIQALSRDTEVVKEYRSDPLVHNKVSVRLGAYLIEGAQYVLDHSNEWVLPLYLAHGTADAICKIAGTDTFYKTASGPITYRRWEGLYHETHNEPEKEKVIQSMTDWIKNEL